MHRERLAENIADVDSSYEDQVVRLGRLDTETSVSATELYYESEADPERVKNTTTALNWADQWLEKITEGVELKKDVLKTLA